MIARGRHRKPQRAQSCDRNRSRARGWHQPGCPGSTTEGQGPPSPGGILGCLAWKGTAEHIPGHSQQTPKASPKSCCGWSQVGTSSQERVFLSTPKSAGWARWQQQIPSSPVTHIRGTVPERTPSVLKPPVSDHRPPVSIPKPLHSSLDPCHAPPDFQGPSPAPGVCPQPCPQQCHRLWAAVTPRERPDPEGGSG